MENFNNKRFVQTLKWSALDSKKEIMSNLTILFAVLLAPQLCYILASMNVDADVAALGLKSVSAISNMALAFYISIGGCWIFNNMKTKQQRITFKMLPASDLEKFLVRLLYVSVFWALSGFAVFVVMDLVRMLICLAVYHDFLFSSTVGLFGWFGFQPQFAMPLYADSALSVLSLSLYVWGHAFYTLGGAVFRRRPFVFTLLASFLLGMVVLMILANLMPLFVTSFSFNPSVWTIYAVAAVFFLASVVFYWLSDRIFRRMQIINNKWLNL